MSFFFLCAGFFCSPRFPQEMVSASLLKRAMEHVFVGEFEKVLVFTSFYTLYLLLSMYCFIQDPFILSFLPLLFLLLNIPSSFFFLSFL